MAHDVFISYAHDDKPVADAACAVLEGKGVRCWIAPRDAVSGIEWGGQIVRAIAEADVLVLIYSRRANESQQVKREVERAVAKGLAIIPFRIEDVPASETLEYFISSPHWLDALTPPMERHLEALAQTVRSVQAHAAKDDTDAVRPRSQVGSAAAMPAEATRAVSQPTRRLGLGVVGGIATAAVLLFGVSRTVGSRANSWNGEWTTNGSFGGVPAAFTLDINGSTYHAAMETRDAGRIGFRGLRYRMINSLGQTADGSWEMLSATAASVRGPLGSSEWTRDPRTASTDPKAPWGTWTTHATIQNIPWTLQLTTSPLGTYQMVSRTEDSGDFVAKDGRWSFGSGRGLPQSGTYARIDATHVSMTGPLGTAVWVRR
jgi:hypothetical protein